MWGHIRVDQGQLWEGAEADFLSADAESMD